ncbi:MAG: DUF2062 domain-containing protein [Pseudomonadota bacterium]
MKKFLRRWTPKPERLRQYRSLRILDRFFAQHNLWYLNRTSVARAVAIAFFLAWMPVPAHTLFSAVAAVFLGANLPLSIVLVWVNNPFTMGPMYYIAYVVGRHVLQRPALPFSFELSLAWLNESFHSLSEPFFVGCLLLGIVCSLIGYIGVQVLWRMGVRYEWHQRRKKRHSNQHK